MWFLQGLGITVRSLAALVVIAVRRRIDMGSSLVLHLAIGWWIGVLVLVRLGGLHMTPPREDGWAGMVGLVAGLLLFCRRYRLGGVAYATVATGFLGGIGFALGQAIKLAGISTDLQTNWHSVMEQTQGMLHGDRTGGRDGAVAATRAGSEGRRAGAAVDRGVLGGLCGLGCSRI